MQTTNFIPANATHIGIMVSGGLDSALMLYLVSKENKEKDFPVQLDVLTVYRSDQAKDHSSRITKIIEELNDITLNKYEVGDPTAPSDVQVVRGVFDALMMKKIPLVIMATTINPEHLKKHENAPVRNPDQFPGILQPWGEITKDNIVKYIKENNLDVLIKNSHSCTVHSFKHCGKCFNCIERKWALDVNNINETTEF